MKSITKRVGLGFITCLINLACLQTAIAQTNVPGSGNAAPLPTISGTPYIPVAYPSGAVFNSLRTWTPKQPYTATSDVISASRTINQVDVSTEYSDGFGRPVQTVNWQASPAGTDLVNPRVYDAYGREANKFLPYASPTMDGNLKTNAFNEQSTFYGTTYLSDQPGFQNERYYYSSTQFESSPQNRVVGGFQTGNSWIGSARGGQNQYLVNNSNDLVQLWTISYSTLSYSANDVSTNIPQSTAVYTPGQLAKKLSVDVNGNQLIEFMDKDGLTVLKKVQVGSVTTTSPYTNWLSTYYIYDDFGRLRFVVPPKVVTALVNAGSWTLSTDMINELCYRYEYDDLDRVIAKKEPGAGWVYMIYDRKDRVVFTQSATMRANNQWLGTIFDNQDRTVQTGMLTYSSGPVSLQAYVNSNTGNSSISGQAVTGDYIPGAISTDLPEPTRVPGVTQYLASNSITFQPGFTSESGASFVAQIVTGGSGATPTSVSLVADNPVPAGATFTTLTQNYYDTYTTTKTYNTTNNSKLDQGANTYADPLPSAATVFTTGLATSSKVRVLENPNDLTQGIWLETARFYDDKGRLIQVQADNYKGGLDYNTSRYDFNNRVVCSYSAHNNPVAQVTNLTVKTNTNYDAMGRTVGITKTINDVAATTRIIEYNQYDALGQLKKKKFGQKTDASGNPISITSPATDNTNWLEINDYAYNIQGWLKGINWNYTAGPTSSNVNYLNNKWFGMDLSYDWGFSTSQYNGNIAGQRWVSAGDGKERSYGYAYDPVSRLLKADFTQNFGGGTSPIWQTSDPNSSFQIDYSVKMGDGSTVSSAYDGNGNIRQMQQMGLVLNTSQQIDNLNYTYESGDMSNKLRAVSDLSGSTAVLGDFTDNNTTADDYGYDVNGNLITDLNKRMPGNTGIDQSSGGAIAYTYQNLPWQITVKNPDGTARGTITFIYDASGKRVEKRVNELASTYNNNTATNTITTYLGAFVYSNNVLQYFTHEDGKIRPLITTQAYAYDYILKDHLRNTRAVLTDEQQTVWFPVATVELSPTASLTTEQTNFAINTNDIVNMSSNVPSYNTAANNNYPNNNGNPPYNTNPNSVTGAQSVDMYKLNGQSGDKTGLGITIKVMTGDVVDIWGKSYYNPLSSVMNTSSLATTALNALIASFANTPVMASGIHGATVTSLQASPVTPSALSSYLTHNIPNPTTTPKAFINWILFDEQFRPVVTGTNSGFLPVTSSTNAVMSLSGTATITTNGYLYVYCSNESNIDVYFDNLQVTQVRGPLLEEDHYYPYGLLMSGISSNAIKTNYTANKYKLSGLQFDDELGLNTYQMKYRSMDPQIGRFQQIDPAADKYAYNSTYAYAENKVTLGSDKEGMELLPFNTAWFNLSASSTPHDFFGLTWTESVQIVDNNIPAVFQGPDGTPLFSPGSVRIGVQGSFSTNDVGTKYFLPSNELPKSEKWPFQPGDPNSSNNTAGKYFSPDPDHYDVMTDRLGGAYSAGAESYNYVQMFAALPVWSAYADLYQNTSKFNTAIGLESNYDNAISKTYPGGQYSPQVKDNITNFILDGTFPNSPDILSSSYKHDLETSLMTGYYGLQVLNRFDPNLIQQATLDTYNSLLTNYNSLPGGPPHFNFILSFLPSNGGYVPQALGLTGDLDSPGGMQFEGDYGSMMIGSGGGDGGDGGE